MRYDQIKVLLTEAINPIATSLFEKEGFTVYYHKDYIQEEKLFKELKEVDILGIRSQTKVTYQVLDYAKKLKVIGCYCVGTDNIDKDICSERNVPIFNDPFSSAESVAEITIGEIIMLLRRIPEKNYKLHEVVWDKTCEGCHEIKGKTLGIVGYGNIGCLVSIFAQKLGMNVCFYDIVDRKPVGEAQKCSNMAELLRLSDVVTIHVDGRSENYNLVSEKEFSLMKDGTCFLNLSRGSVVDINALIKNLKKKKIKGAAIDVFPVESKDRLADSLSELKKFPNVILTPHIGGGTEEAQQSIATYVSNKIINYIRIKHL